MTATFTPHAGWKIKDGDLLGELISLIGVNDAEKALLGSLYETAKARGPQMADDFYGRLGAHSNTLEFISNAPMAGLRNTIIDWFCQIFSGTYDNTYAERRLRIGEVHVKIGLPVRYPLAMLDVVMEHGSAVAASASDPEAAKQAFHKLLALDVAIFNQAYENNQLAHLSELVGGEMLARRLLSGAA